MDRSGGHGTGAAREDRTVGLLVLCAAIAVAVVGARSSTGSWNDASRLATVESLVDHHTLVIDASTYLPATLDRLFIDGHFYSDKSPVPALLMAGWYQVLQWSTGLTARQRPDRFCYWMTLGSAGLAYVVAVRCIFQLGRPLGLALLLRVALSASFGLATVALTYSRQVNNHILLLGVAAALLLGLVRLAESTRSAQVSGWQLLSLGTLAGLGYTIDLGAGPLLLACTLAVVACRCRRLAPVVVFALAAVPWLVLHHVLNHAIGGTFRPANAVPEYMRWPGSPFNPGNLTGILHHTVGHFFTYAGALLVGGRGFLGHNLPLFLALTGFVQILRQRPPERAEILGAGTWSCATWLLYALTSNNYSGVCASIRWFVPLLAPGYFVLAVFLRDHPRYRPDFLVLSAWGVVIGALMWWQGPWMGHAVPRFWSLQAAALASWVACWAWRAVRPTAGTPRGLTHPWR